MRIELEIIQKIEMYLMGTLSPEEKRNFETEMSQNPELKKNVDLQRSITEGISRLALKTSAQNAHASYKLQAFLTKLIMIAVLAAAATFATIALLNSDTDETVAPAEYDEKAFTFPENDSLSADANQYLEQEFFRIKTNQDTIVETKDGIVIYIPADAFNTTEAEVDLLIQGAVTTEDILEAGLSTITADGEELETGGMFYIDAYVDGKRVDLKKELTVDVPTNEKKAGMELYDGEKNANGEIVWNNPKKIESFLTPVEITSLDFYPPGYEDKAHELGYSEKEFLDSLYYSFVCEDSGEDFIIGIGEDQITSGNARTTPGVWQMPSSIHEVIEWKFEQRYLGNNTFEVEIKAIQKDGWYIYSQVPADGLYEATEISFDRSSDFSLSGKTSESGRSVRRGKDGLENMMVGDQAIFKQKIIASPGTTISGGIKYMAGHERGVVFPPDHINFSGTFGGNNCEGINPESIKTIWNKDYNKTNLATKEFQERMPWIHQSCNNAVLELYINNLDKPLSTVDSMAFKYLSGEVLQQFKEFALRGDGRVELDNKAAQKLANHYETKRKAIAQALAETQQQFWNEQAGLDNKNALAQSGSDNRSNINKGEIFQKEYEKNLCKVFDELALTQNCVYAELPKKTYTVGVGSLGWKNIDMQVYQATYDRQTTTFSANGKTSTLTYNPWSATIADFKTYDRINVYNIPVEFNSYIKLPGTKGKYEYKLNADIQYKTIVLAWTADGIYFHGDLTTAGDHNISLKKVTEDEWKNNIRTSLSSLGNMKDELDYVDYAQKDQKRTNSNKERQQLREKIEPVVFPCGVMGDSIVGVPALSPE